ncbi:MAG: glycosyltransferase [Candidatus Lokiarchaeota archaeon]|nr:glycosyltransferase [Candidatus Lokiarchaeota archaeon]
MKISIIIPSYNNENTIKRVLEGLLNQNFQNNFEIIVVDDNSTDNTVNIIKSFNKIKLITKEKNYGLAHSLNLGLDNANGNFIGFLHGDCIPHKSWLKQSIKIFENHKKVGAVVAPSYVPIEIWQNYDYYSKIFLLKQTTKYNKKRVVESKNKIIKKLGGIKSTIFRKEIFKEIGPFNSKKYRAAGEDGDTLLKILNTNWRIMRIKFPSKHLHGVNKKSIKGFLKSVARTSEANGVLLRTYKRRRIKNLNNKNLLAPFIITIIYCLNLIIPLINLFINSFILSIISICFLIIFLSNLIFYTIKIGLVFLDRRILTLPFIKFIKDIYFIYGFWRGFIMNNQRI